MRLLLLTTLLVGLAACGDDSGKTPTGGQKNPAPTIDNPPPLAPTGAPRIQSMRQDLFETVARMEQEVDEGRMPERRLFDELKRGIDVLTQATERAIAEEARQLVEHDLASLRVQQGELAKRRVDLVDGIREVSTMVDEIRRGVGRPPEGFTEDELKDRLGELQEQARALDKEDEEIRARMTEKEKLLAGDTVPPQGRTRYTDELDAIKELRARVDALEARLG